MVELFAMDISRLPGTQIQRHRQGRNALLAAVLPRFSVDPGDITISDRGKPQVPGLHFNLSHSGDFVVCATGEAPLGCDIQRHHPARLHRFLSQSERRALEALTEPGRGELYTRLWTLRESYLKMTGEGLAGLGRLRVDLSAEPFALLDAGRRPECRFCDYEIPGYALTVCTRWGDFAPEIRWIPGNTEEE